MANAIYNKRKTSQLIKTEKENENIELRKRMRSSTKDKYSTNKKETVWERLSKVKKMPSTENFLGITKSRNLNSKTCQRFQTIRQMVVNHPQHLLQEPQLQIVNCKPLSPKNASSYNGRLNATHKSKTIVIPEIKNEERIYAFKRNKSVNEIMTVRSLSNSKSSSDGYKSAKRQYSDIISPSLTPSVHGEVGTKVTTNEQMFDSSEDSNDEFKLAPLMSSRSDCDPNSSTLITNKFRKVLRNKNKSMAPDDIELVKDVIKSDHRYRSANEHDPKLFKDILQTQLQDILKHEFVVKKALDKLESSASLQSNQTKELSDIVGYAEHVKEPQKLEVDVIFKNVPSLEKEIIILRALGEKLEATLRSTATRRGTSISPPIIDKLIDKKVQFMVKKEIQHYAEVEQQVLGIVYYVGIVKEFSIAQKTIVELKQEANRPFYIPSNLGTADLKRTSFKKLKENPNILLRHIKAKNSIVTFNVLDQDPVFFNNILFNNAQTLSSQSLAVSTDEECYVKKVTPLCEGGDSRIWRQTDHDFSHEPLNYKYVDSKHNLSILKSVCEESIDAKSIKPLKSIEPDIRGKQRRRIRRSLTPMPTNPKNTLFKTLFIGFLQIHLFILLIMALTYPEPKC